MWTTHPNVIIQTNMSKYLDVQDPFDKKRKVKALRAKVKMGGTTTRNGKEVNVGTSKHWALKNKQK